MQVPSWARVRCFLSSIGVTSGTDWQKGRERETLPARLSLGRSQEPLYTALAVWRGEGKVLFLKAAFSSPICFLQEVFIGSGDFTFRLSRGKNDLLSN